jgi:DNA-binding SARP family transcriptional activator
MGSFSATLHFASTTRALSLPRRGAELLALFALSRGRFLQRTEIGQLFGLNSEFDVSPQAVSTAVWRLRRLLESPPVQRGDYLVKDHYGAIGLNGPGSVSLDVSEFEQLARSGLCGDAENASEAHVAALRAAGALYKECLMPGFSTEWVLRERERLRRTFLEVLYRLMQIEAARGRYQGAIEYAQQILALDRVREDVQRALMRYFVLNGQRGLALRQFEVCRAALKQELAIQPMRETVALYQEISALATEPSDAGANGPAARGTPVCPARTGTDNREVVSHLMSARALISEADSHLRQSIDSIEQ